MLKDKDNTKDKLRDEFVELRQRITLLEKSENQLKRVEEALKHRIELENLISTISTNFINVAPDEIDKEINHALKLIGEFAGVDRSYIFLFYDNATKMDNIHEWCAEGIEPQMHNFQGISIYDEFPWVAQKIKGLETVYIPRVTDLPPEARAEKELMQMQSIQSLIVVPIVCGKSPIGSVGFDSVRKEKTWSEDDIKLLRIVGEIFANALTHKRAEEAFRESEKRFRELVDLLPQTVFETDEKGNLTFTNAYGLKSSGYTQEDLDKGLNALQLFIPEDRDRVKENMRRILRGEKLGSKEYTALKKNGSTFPVIIYSSPIIRENRPVGLRGIVIDITERKRAEEALKQRAEELERSKAELEQSLQELLERVEHEHEVLVTLPVPVIDIEEKGATFLYPLDKEKEVYALFRSRKDANRPALAITRTFPPRFHKKLGREVETVWLTSNRVPSMVCVDPSDTMNLLLVLTEFFKRAPEGVVLFEGVEYVISIAGFERFLHIVQLLNDKIAMTEGAIYMILDLAVLEKKERRYILRECLSPLNGFGNREEAKGSKNKA